MAVQRKDKSAAWKVNPAGTKGLSSVAHKVHPPKR